jgi:hypothetical protein
MMEDIIIPKLENIKEEPGKAKDLNVQSPEK